MSLEDIKIDLIVYKIKIQISLEFLGKYKKYLTKYKINFKQHSYFVFQNQF